MVHVRLLFSFFDVVVSCNALLCDGMNNKTLFLSKSHLNFHYSTRIKSIKNICANWDKYKLKNFN